MGRQGQKTDDRPSGCDQRRKPMYANHKALQNGNEEERASGAAYQDIAMLSRNPFGYYSGVSLEGSMPQTHVIE
jgi:hypothetical protein